MNPTSKGSNQIQQSSHWMLICEFGNWCSCLSAELWIPPDMAGMLFMLSASTTHHCTITMLSRNPSQELLMRSSISVESATIATGEPARQNNSHRLSSATGGVNPLLLAREHRERAWNRCKVDQRMYSRSRIGFLIMWSRWTLEFYESRLWQVSTTPLNLAGVLVADPWQI